MNDTPRTKEFDARQQQSDHRYDWAERHAHLLEFTRELERDLELQLRINAEGCEREAKLRSELEGYKWWHEAYLKVGDALGINEPELSGHGWFAECVLELKAENAKLRAQRDAAIGVKK